MAETVAASAIILEVLNKYNYDDWKIRLQTYLEGQDLWDVMEANDDASKEDESEAEIKAWKKKNATALHAIHISCGSHFATIRKIKSAKDAWEKLEEKFRPPVVKESSNSSDDNFQYKSFFDAVSHNNLDIAQPFLSDPEALRSRHPISDGTALHVATINGHEKIVKELVRKMQKEDLGILDRYGNTALFLAIRNRKTSIAKFMVERNQDILGISPRGMSSLLPVTMAFMSGDINLARYLYTITPQKYLFDEECCPGVPLLSDSKQAEPFCPGAPLLLSSMQAKQYDISLDLLQKCPLFPISKIMLPKLCDLRAAIPTASRLNFWQHWIYERINLTTGKNCVNVSNSEDSQITRRNITCSGVLKQFASNGRKLLGLLPVTLKNLLGIKNLYKMKLADTCLSKVLERICDEIKTLNYEQLRADTSIRNEFIHIIANGEVDFVERLTHANQELLDIHDEVYRNMIMIAVQNRQEKIVSFIVSFIARDPSAHLNINFRDKSGNSLLHMTGLLPPSSRLNIIPGPAFQMQKELQWFQEVESLIESETLKSLPNYEDMTAREYFTKNHEELRKRGEKWMKETASSYSFVAALMVTVVFAAGFIVPGGGNDMRSLSHEKWFLVFIISDAVSLFSSTTSVIIFLGILTSRYNEAAFLKSLPTKLILGMSALFVSIATMMLCFCAALYEMLQGQLRILIPIILLASIPVSLFISLQFHLLIYIIISTYGSGLGIAPKKDKKRWFCW